MQLAHVIRIVTPKKFVLDGFWFGPASAKRVIVHVHGLGSSAFSCSVVREWVGRDTAVVTFSNRGHDAVARVKRLRPDGKHDSITSGSAHEVFTDCVDDIQGAVDFVKAAGVRDVILSGHSTGCQKIVYYAARTAAKPDRAVRGLILLAPISDYAGTEERVGKRVYARALAAATKAVRSGKPHALLSEKVWARPIDAQRWLSLYTPGSAEEIFTYAQPRRAPRTLRRSKLPLLVLLAEKDEYADRPALDIARWFAANSNAGCGTVQIVPDVGHGFTGAEKPVRRLVRWWLGGM